MSDFKAIDLKREILNQFNELNELLPIIQETCMKCLQQDISRENIQYEISRIRISDRLKLEKKILKEISAIFKGKWVIDILFTLVLLEEPHFNDLQKAIPNIGSKILTERLKYFEKSGIVIRNVIASQPVRVTYSLSDFGLNFIILLFPVIIHWIKNKVTNP